MIVETSNKNFGLIIMLILIISMYACYPYTYQTTPTDINARMIQSQKGLEDKCNSFVGKITRQLVVEWGPPYTSVSDESGGKILTYRYAEPIGIHYYVIWSHFYVDGGGKIYHSKVIQNYY